MSTQEKLQESISIVDSNKIRQYNAPENENELNSQLVRISKVKRQETITGCE